MKWFRMLAGITICLVVLMGGYRWVTAMMDGIYDYQSPLAKNPPVPGEALAAPQVRRVVVALVDGLRLDTAQDAETMPFLAELRSQGAWARMHSRPPSYSQTGYSVLFIGAWPSLSGGPAVNLDYAETPAWAQDNLFSAARRSGLTTAAAAYQYFERLIPAQALDYSFFTAGEDRAADEAVMLAALPWLQTGQSQLVLIHLDQVDYAGHHEGGPRDPHWNAAAGRVDEHLRQIAAELDFSQDVLMVVSDHGHINAGGHGGQDPDTLQEPWLLVGAKIIPGDYGDVQMVDVAPTLAVLMGTNIPAAAQGTPQLEMLDLAPADALAAEALWQAQQKQLMQAYSEAIGLPATTIEPGKSEIVTQARLLSERSQRVWFVVPLLSLLALLLVIGLRRSSLQMGPFLAGILAYWVVFHSIYLLSGRTYSLSSARSQEEMLLNTGLFSLLGLVAAWGVHYFFKKWEGGWAEDSSSLTLGLLGSLALPLLWSYWLNGLMPTWNLPDFASFYLAFLSLLQAMAVAAGGLVGLALLGLWAAVSRRYYSIRRPA